MEVEIGRGKKARRAYGFDDIAIVPSRRTRDPDDVDISWTLGPYRFDLPLMASAMDGVVSPETAVAIGRLGGLAVLNLEGIWCRYEDAETQLERIAGLEREEATREMQDIYAEPVKPELIRQRIEEISQHGVVVAASLTPQRVEQYYEVALDAGLDIMVIQGTVISAEHVSTQGSVLNLKEFIAEMPIPVVAGGCASYHTGLHLMRSGAVGVLVGVGPAPRAPRAASSASGSRRRRRSPTSPPRGRRTCSRRATTAGSSPTVGCATAVTSPRRSPAARTP
jgi:IMP dehydrogenase